MRDLFDHASNFNNGDEPGESNNPLEWDVSNVTNMACMFCYAISFNQDIHRWSISNLTNIWNMFRECPINETYKPTQ